MHHVKPWMKSSVHNLGYYSAPLTNRYIYMTTQLGQQHPNDNHYIVPPSPVNQAPSKQPSSQNKQPNRTKTMPNTKTIKVPHLGGITAAYQTSHPLDPSKPTLVLINSFTTSSELYTQQYEDPALTGAVNLLAIELLGHGQTRTRRENWTYWDTAEMNLQVLDVLGIERAFVLGTSQGGWVTARMALMRPEKVHNIYPSYIFIYVYPPPVEGGEILIKAMTMAYYRSPVSSPWAHPWTRNAKPHVNSTAGTRRPCLPPA